MTTPNTTGPSDEIQRFDPALNEASVGLFSLTMDPSTQGDWVYYADHLAALSRAREEARKEALEEAAQAVEDQWWLDEIGKAAVKIIRALLTPTPQGETKEND